MIANKCVQNFPKTKLGRNCCNILIPLKMSFATIKKEKQKFDKECLKKHIKFYVFLAHFPSDVILVLYCF